MATPVLAKMKKFDPKDPNPCSECSYCCEYVALEIDAPTTVRDFDTIYWYVLHKDVWVYIDTENDWYIQFNTKCEKLVDQRCGHYHSRPVMCRSYAVKSCSRYGTGEGEEKVIFKNQNDLFNYLSKRRPSMYKKLIERTQTQNVQKSIPVILKTKSKPKPSKAKIQVLV